MMSDIFETYWSYALCGVVLFLLIIHFVTEWDSITFGVTEMFSNELVGLPTSNTNINRIRDILQEEEIDTQKITLVDFGCGKGDVLDVLDGDFKRLIGIELNQKLASLAKRRHRDNNKVRIRNIDIMDYRFKKRPTLLYAYEPLWQVESSRADEIYRDVIDRLSKLDHPTYVVYLTGIHRSDLVPILKESDFELVRHASFGIYPYRDLYIYRLNPET